MKNMYDIDRLQMLEMRYKKSSLKKNYEIQKEHPSSMVKHWKRISLWDLESEARFIRDCGRTSKGIHYPREHEKFSDEFYNKARILSIEYIKEDIKNKKEELIIAEKYMKEEIAESEKLLKNTRKEKDNE